MKERLARYAERIDAMTLRERITVFGAAAAVLILILYGAMISPTLERQRRMGAEITRQQAAQRDLNSEIQKILKASQVDPDAATRARLAEIKTRIAENERTLTDLNARLAPPDRIRGLLESLIARERGLELVELKTLPLAPLLPTADGALAPESQVYRHGVELTVRGTYLELLRYLEGLEDLSVRMYWGRVEVAATDYPTVTMKLTVYTISLDRAWITV